MTNIYKNNSMHKDFVRSRWIEYINEIRKQSQSEECRIITFPAEEMQDLALFADNGIISWEETETGAFRITKGKVICFEKKTNIYKKISQKLAGAYLENYEIGKYFEQRYNKLINGQASIFPVDVINLDFDGNLSKNDTNIIRIIELIFQFQKLHMLNFSLFLTFPQTESDDEEDFISNLEMILRSNLNDEFNSNFISQFETKYNSIEDLDYNEFLILGITKHIVKTASYNNYGLSNQEFYIYGEENKKQMLSILLNFNYLGVDYTTPSIYYRDVMKVLEDIRVLGIGCI